MYLFGHTHQKCYLQNKNKHYINPGSLGCPSNSKVASAGILEINNNNIKYKQIEIEYDVEKVINKIRKLNYPLCNFIINTFYKYK